jgi:hypothetical protein
MHAGASKKLDLALNFWPWSRRACGRVLVMGERSRRSVGSLLLSPRMDNVSWCELVTTGGIIVKLLNCPSIIRVTLLYWKGGSTSDFGKRKRDPGTLLSNSPLWARVAGCGSLCTNFGQPPDYAGQFPKGTVRGGSIPLYSPYDGWPNLDGRRWLRRRTIGNRQVMTSECRFVPSKNTTY